ncbi:MAG: hypothetical protein G01um101413_303 [Parcubacteria group bacterium Gr01-1014_13]|nr:MAG: hypothetical protein G01um101413_303 [Parcubacteria group bacterium Gr01-1014_13]
MIKKIFALPLLAIASLSFAGQALAHAVVKPAEVGIGKYQTFTLAVPSEKSIATVGIRLVMPEGINSATPNVKNGWKIEKKIQATGNKVKDEEGMMIDEQRLIEITWTGGNISAGMRDEFLFSVKSPSKPTILNWKVYQTYADGTVVAWDLDPATKEKKSGFGPYSMTKVIDDLSASPISTLSKADASDSNSTVALALSAAAFVISLGALRKAKK